MKKIVLILLGVFTFIYVQCQQTDNITSVMNSEISASVATESQTFEYDLITTMVESEATTTKATKLSLMPQLISRQVKKEETNSNASPKVKKNNAIALISSIMGIFSVLSFFSSLPIIRTIGPLAAIAAIIIGLISKRRINNGKGSGKGWAIIGILGGILYWLLWFSALRF